MLRLTSWLLTVMLVAVGADDISQALEQETCQGEDCALNALQLRGTVDPEPNSTRAASGVNMSWAHFGCCSGCSTRYYSPNSGTCYSYKGKYYYLDCGGYDDSRRRRSRRRRRTVDWHDYQYNTCCQDCKNWFYCSPNRNLLRHQRL